uniref:SusC/RagA family TonB-linked outer membrane protein n=1 Tax=Roseihalotalea indica TaxID=2867963 RepID=A0AA49GL43_9BACT|nr:SusC/RagA family TonB-linked outer membrane protein [Tunicatimonas sp. TK19036]
MKRYIYPLVVLWGIGLLSSQALAQNRTVSGKVTASETGETLPGVNVLVKGTSTGTVTDVDGNYRISVNSENSVIVFSFIGYETLEEAVGNRSAINVALAASVEQLSEVVVTSFGIEREKKALGYSVQELSSEEITETQQPNVVNALRGKVAGVTIQSSGGQPGAGANIVIRGLTSLSPTADNQPLFVVDGIPISNSTVSGDVLPSAGSNAINSDEQFGQSNRAVDLNPDDIESMSILKGPAATALYGLRAANGAVIITTKKGKAGKATVSLSSSFGWDNVNKWPESQTRFREGRFGRLRFNSDGSPLRFQQFGPPSVASTPFYDNFRDFFETGTRVDNSISVSGGNENTTFFASASRLDQQGIVPYSEWDRTTFKLSAATKASEKVQLTGTMNYINSGGVRSNGGDKSIFSSLSYYSPTFDVNDYINPDGTQRDFSDGIIDNPVYIARFANLNDNVNRMIGNMGITYQITDWLNLDYKIGTDFYSDSRKRIAPLGLDVSSQVNGFVIEEEVNYQEINSNLFVTAKKDFNERLKGSILVGHNLTNIRSDRTNVRGEGLTLRGFDDLSNATNFFTLKDASLRRIVGVFTNIELEYDGTFFLTLTGRNDWSSTLPANNRSFFYPSINLGYIFTETLGLGDNDIFNYGKLRLSYAEVGKDAPPYRTAQSFEIAPGSPYLGQSGFRIYDQVGNPDLKPERTSSYEIGTDLRFFNNKIAVDLTYFVQNSTDQIIPVPVSNATGFSRFYTNAGEIQNRGIELLINATPLRVGDFRWDASLNWSKIDNEVLSMPEGIDEIIFTDAFYIQNKLVEGGSAGDLYGFAYNRTDDGRLLISDDGFPSVNTTEYVKVGNALPDWQGGLTNTFRYKGLSLSVLLELRQGGDIYDLGFRNALRNGILKETERRYEQIIFKGVRNVGDTDNPQYVENDVPVEITGETVYRDYGRYTPAADVILQDASWFRVRNANITYALPQSVLDNTFFTSARVSFTGNNLFLNTPYKGYDPESSQFGSGSNSYGFAGLGVPQTRSYTVGINVTF